MRSRARTSKPYRRRPAAPFITSTLQQEAARKLGMASAAAMRAAQSLYEKGYISYMRTDSTSLSADAVAAARAEVARRYGTGVLPDKPRAYARKVKNAQEAHEAIRPAGDAFTDPRAVAQQVPRPEARLYELIWQRTLASQMTDCTGETVQLRVGARTSAGRDAEFSASGTVIKHLGFREVYTEGTDAGEAGETDAERRLPPLNEGDEVACRGLEASGHETQPPARYTEASLVRRLEELGVGRPSTYSSIMGTIADRGYVWKKGSALVPSFTAFSVVNLLERHFPKLVDYAFTAEMEDDLDRIAAGAEEQVPWLRRFYFGGDDDPGLKEKVSSRLGDIDARRVNSISLGTDDDGRELEVRVGRYGPTVQRGDDSAPVPDGTAPDELTVERVLELLATGRSERVLGTAPDTGLTVVAKSGRYGPYVQLGLADEVEDKPKFASLFKTMSLDTVTLDDALKLLSLPRTVGADPADGVEITVQNGRYGPFVRKGSDSRSLAGEEQLFTVTLEECLQLLAQPKTRGRAAAAAPLRGAGGGPRHRPGGGGEGRPLRPLRHRRRGQRIAAHRRHRGGHQPGAGQRAAGRAAGQGPGQEAPRPPQVHPQAPLTQAAAGPRARSLVQRGRHHPPLLGRHPARRGIRGGQALGPGRAGVRHLELLPAVDRAGRVGHRRLARALRHYRLGRPARPGRVEEHRHRHRAGHPSGAGVLPGHRGGRDRRPAQPQAGDGGLRRGPGAGAGDAAVRRHPDRAGGGQRPAGAAHHDVAARQGSDRPELGAPREAHVGQLAQRGRGLRHVPGGRRAGRAGWPRPPRRCPTRAG